MYDVKHLLSVVHVCVSVRDPQPDPHPPPQEANPEQEPQPVVNEEIRDEGRINETDNVNQEEPLEHNEVLIIDVHIYSHVVHV